MKVNMDTLRESHPRLYRTVVKYHFNLRETSGEQEIDESRLSEFTRGELLDWRSAQPALQSAEPLPPQIDLDAEFKADLQRAADEARGLARLEQYCVEQGLERTPANAKAVQDFIDSSPVKGYWSREIVDAAIQNLGPKGSNVLTWTPQALQPPPAPTPAPVVEYLPNGEPRLPLDIDERSMKSSSVPQLKDLVERRRAATNQRYIRRGHGASF
jgi:hypothetical protein